MATATETPHLILNAEYVRRQLLGIATGLRPDQEARGFPCKPLCKRCGTRVARRGLSTCVECMTRCAYCGQELKSYPLACEDCWQRSIAEYAFRGVQHNHPDIEGDPDHGDLFETHNHSSHNHPRRAR